MTMRALRRLAPRVRAPAGLRAPGPPAAALTEPPATLFVRPEVLRAVTAAAVASGGHETGGPLLGTTQPSWDGDGAPRLLVAVLATVPAGSLAAAGPASVALGAGADGDRAAAALGWWRSTTGLDLVHLGDWHKHPSRCPEPSSGDRATAARMRAMSQAPVWLTAVATSTYDHREEPATAGHAARLTREWAAHAEVRFYRHVEPDGLVPVAVRLEPDAIPALPALPWHVTDPARFAAECRLLHAAGFATGFATAVDGDAAGSRPGLTLRLARDGDEPLTVVTGPGYPHEAPLVVDERGRRRAAPGWGPDRFLADLVREVA
jgi:hypothetical protein